MIARHTSKRYACSHCGHETQQTTNHYGQTYSAGRVNTCPKCPPYLKYPEYGGGTVWNCLDSQPKPILELSHNGDPYGTGFVASESTDGGETWFYRGDIGAMPRSKWRHYARQHRYILREVASVRPSRRKGLLSALLLLLVIVCPGCEHFAVELDHGRCIYNHAPPPAWPIGHGR